jgi:tRNA threonylcarbamoyladenosine biosynthesis protein TsaB
LSTIKGLSIVRNKPVVGVSTLDILAENVISNNALIVPAIDARRGLIYCCSYKREKGMLKRKSEYKLLTLDEFIKKFADKAVILGDAADLYKDKILARSKGVFFLDKDYCFPKAHNLIRLALEKIRIKQFSSAQEIKPIYLYPQECQIKKR